LNDNILLKCFSKNLFSNIKYYITFVKMLKKVLRCTCLILVIAGYCSTISIPRHLDPFFGHASQAPPSPHPAPTLQQHVVFKIFLLLFNIQRSPIKIPKQLPSRVSVMNNKIMVRFYHWTVLLN